MGGAHPPIAMEWISAVQDAVKRGDRYPQLPRSPQKPAGRDEARCAEIQDARAVGRHLKQLKQVEALVARTMEIIQPVWIDQEPIFVGPSVPGQLWRRPLHGSLKPGIVLVGGVGLV